MNNKLAIGIVWLSMLLWACNSPAQKAEKQDYDCKNCGMPSQDYPQWNAKIELAHQTYWFCSPKCMFSRYHKLQAGEVKNIWVKNYYTTKFMDAKKSFFVIGSKILGPMGHDLVPFSDALSAESFTKEHQGRETLPFEKVTGKVLKEKLTSEE